MAPETRDSERSSASIRVANDDVNVFWPLPLFASLGLQLMLASVSVSRRPQRPKEAEELRPLPSWPRFLLPVFKEFFQPQ